MPERDTIREYQDVFINYLQATREDAQERGF